MLSYLTLFKVRVRGSSTRCGFARQPMQHRFRASRGLARGTRHSNPKLASVESMRKDILYPYLQNDETKGSPCEVVSSKADGSTTRLCMRRRAIAAAAARKRSFPRR